MVINRNEIANYPSNNSVGNGSGSGDSGGVANKDLYKMALIKQHNSIIKDKQINNRQENNSHCSQRNIN